MELTEDELWKRASARRDAETLYVQLLGAAFERLPAQIRQVHDVRDRKAYAGRCRIRTGSSLFARSVAFIARLPHAHEDASVSVLIERRGTTETWTRSFDGREMKSRLRLHRGALEERLGDVVLTFALAADGERILWRLQRARLWVFPLPLWLLSACTATESVVEGRYCFDVRAELAGVGLIVHYTGWLAEHE